MVEDTVAEDSPDVTGHTEETSDEGVKTVSKRISLMQLLMPIKPSLHNKQLQLCPNLNRHNLYPKPYPRLRLK